MLSVNLQTNSITFFSGFLLQEIQLLPWTLNCKNIIQDVCKSILKLLKHKVMSVPIQTNWSQIVNDFGTCGTSLIAVVKMSYNLCDL
jgi:hypothetical protein